MPDLVDLVDLVDFGGNCACRESVAIVGAVRRQCHEQTPRLVVSRTAAPLMVSKLPVDGTPGYPFAAQFCSIAECRRRPNRFSLMI
jgi:hypothetical protein